MERRNNAYAAQQLRVHTVFAYDVATVQGAGLILRGSKIPDSKKRWLGSRVRRRGSPPEGAAKQAFVLQGNGPWKESGVRSGGRVMLEPSHFK